MATSTSIDICVVCSREISGVGGSGGGRKVGPKGQSSLLAASRQREDELHSKLSHADNIYVHDKCYKHYTLPRKIAQACICEDSTSGRNSPAPSLRSVARSYDYQTHCLICAKEFDFEAVQHHPETYSQISSVEIVSKEKTSILQESLLNKCESRNDTVAVNVKARILFAGDIRAVEAKYHRSCMQAFMSGRNISTSVDCEEYPRRNIRNINELNDEAFSHLCEWLRRPEQQQGQFTLLDLRTQLATYLPKDVPAYSIKHIKRRLYQNFGEKVIIAEVEGRPNVVTLTESATSLIHQSYASSSSDMLEEGEDIRTAKEVGCNIKEKLQSMDHLTDVYPSPLDSDFEKLQDGVPETLRHLIASMFTESRSESAKMKKELLQASICHVIMQAAGKQSFISPLLLSIGLLIHQTTRSRVLLDALSSLGLCVSYAQVMAFERAAAVKQSAQNLPSGLTERDKGGGFCQWVADNFDYNEDTISGKDSTHAMGIIACQSVTPHSDKSLDVIHRRSVTSLEVLQAGDFGAMVQPYKPPLKSMMAEVKIKSLKSIDVQVFQYELLDTLWLYSSCLSPNPPNWQGFMSEVTKGKCQCTAVVYNPMLPLNPQTDEAVYSTMIFVQSQAEKVGMCCATLTFDQPLYLKSYKIKQDNYQNFRNVYLRLGGFHQLMSFLGAGCKLMEGSGLEDLWAVAYAGNSIPKMLEGKAYRKASKACLLTDAALHLLLMQ